MVALAQFVDIFHSPLGLPLWQVEALQRAAVADKAAFTSEKVARAEAEGRAAAAERELSATLEAGAGEEATRALLQRQTMELVRSRLGKGCACLK